MDYTSVPRSLFYKENTDLSIFTRKRAEDSLEYQFYKKLKRIPFFKFSFDAPTYVQEILNNACYICTMIHYEEQPSLYFGRYLTKATTKCEGAITEKFIQLSTFALIYNWLNTEWFEKEKHRYYGDDEGVGEIKEIVYQYLMDDSSEDIEWRMENIWPLVLDANSYHSYMDLYCFYRRSIGEAIEDSDVSIIDIVNGIDFISDSARYEGKKELDVLTQAQSRLEKEANACDHLSVYKKKHAFDTIEKRIRELGGLPKDAPIDTTTPIVDKSVHNYYISNNNEAELERLRKDCEEWKQKYEEALEQEPDRAFNSQTGKPCFTSAQMGILMYAIACLTEDTIPGKTTLGDVIERIAGYKKSTASQNMKGSFREADKETVAAAIESKFPKLAAKVRSL